MAILAFLAHLEIVLTLFGTAPVGIKLDLVGLIFTRCGGRKREGSNRPFIRIVSRGSGSWLQSGEIWTLDRYGIT